MASLVFFAFMIVLTDMVRICYNWVSLQYAVNEAARFGSLGSSGGGSRASAITDKVVDIAGRLGVHDVDVSFTDEAGGGTPGGGLSFYELQAQTLIVLNPISGVIFRITGDFSGTYEVTAKTIIRNEPFV